MGTTRLAVVGVRYSCSFERLAGLQVRRSQPHRTSTTTIDSSRRDTKGNKLALTKLDIRLHGWHLACQHSPLSLIATISPSSFAPLLMLVVLYRASNPTMRTFNLRHAMRATVARHQPHLVTPPQGSRPLHRLRSNVPDQPPRPPNFHPQSLDDPPH